MNGWSASYRSDEILPRGGIASVGGPDRAATTNGDNRRVREEDHGEKRIGTGDTL